LAVSIVIESGQHESTLTRAPSYSEPARDMPPASQRGEEQKAGPSVEPEAAKPAAAPAAASEEVRSGAAEREREVQALREQVQRRSAPRALAAPPSTEAREKRAGPQTESSAAADSTAERARQRKQDDLNDQVTQS